MRTVGIKLADGSFYPIMEEGSAQTKKLELTTANDNQTCVMVDLYRSKTCSMEDAEYIDTLKIENLNAHQNGEPSISFDVGLDENGELSASIADPETGATSNSQLTLVSRTAEERLVTDDFAVEEPAVEDETSVEEDSGNGAAAAAGIAAGAGLLAAAGIMAANKNKDDEAEDATLSDDDISEVTEDAGLDDFSFEETPAQESPAESESLEDFSFDDTPSEETIADQVIADDNLADDNPEDDTFADESTEAEGLASFDETISDDDPFASDQPLSTDETISDDDPFASDETITEEPAADETISDETLPDMDFDMAEDSSAASESNGFIADDDSFDLPDDTTISDDSTIPGDETILEDDSFNAPQDLTENQEEETDDFFNDTDSDPTPAPAQELNFSGLYDKETEMGESAAHDDDDIKKKTRAPVIICVVCAIICIIATILVLLVLPGKFNLRQKHAEKKSQTAVEKQAEAPAPKAEKKAESVPQAKEDEVVVIEKAEEVKPLPPPTTETKSKNVTYKIKWGDTLWDIADTYYKNPWRYKKIANYNGIKNPDHIISGTIITIPAE